MLLLHFPGVEHIICVVGVGLPLRFPLQDSFCSCWDCWQMTCHSWVLSQGLFFSVKLCPQSHTLFGDSLHPKTAWIWSIQAQVPLLKHPLSSRTSWRYAETQVASQFHISFSYSLMGFGYKGTSKNFWLQIVSVRLPLPEEQSLEKPSKGGIFGSSCRTSN